MKASERLQFYRDEVERSKSWRSNNYDGIWHRLIDLYRGKQYQQASPNDQLIVNLAFATKNVIAPSVAINNPRFVVNARKPDNAPNAVIVEEVLNYLWRCYKYQEEIRLTVDDWLVCGHGWIKAGYKFVKEPVVRTSDTTGDSNVVDTGADEGIDDRMPTEGNVETEMEVRADRPASQHDALDRPAHLASDPGCARRRALRHPSTQAGQRHDEPPDHVRLW
jgi:hypothetical protein